MKRTNNSSSLLFILLIAIPLIIIAVFACVSMFKTGCFVRVSDKEENEIVEPDTSDVIEQEPEVVPEPEPEPEKIYRNISFAAAGDILVHTNVYKYASQLAQGTDAEYDFKPMFANIKDVISSADLAYVNQETPSAGKDRGYSGYPMFNTPDEIADAVLETGFDIVNIANNHMLDKGESGLKRNIDFWNSKGITLLGGFKNMEDYNNIRLIEKDGVKIALLSYTYGTNGLALPKSSELVIPYENADEISRQTKEARELADIVIVSMHWGHEDHFKPSDNQKNLAKMMAENGVDVILGMHPHVLQPIEWLDRPDGKQTLCVYSLGNLISTMMYSRNMLGGIITFDIAENDEGFSIENVELIPTMLYYTDGYNKPTIYLYKNYTEEMQLQHGSRRNEKAKSIDYLNNIITSTIDKQFINDEYFDSIYGVEAETDVVPAA